MMREEQHRTKKEVATMPINPPIKRALAIASIFWVLIESEAASGTVGLTGVGGSSATVP
jgi:hypothetical protein